MKKILILLLLTNSLSAFRQLSTDSSFIPKNVAILLYDGVELLDFAGPGEIFQQARFNGNKPFHVYTVGVTKKEIISQDFLKIITQFTIDDSPIPDILVIPGGNSLSQVTNEKD